MIKTFTQHDLIRYLYRETSEKETKEISHALVCDAELQALYNDICDLKTQLEVVRLEPSAASVQSILSYAKSAVKAKE